MAKNIKYLRNEKTPQGYIRVWKGSRETIVQVWKSGRPVGEPDGDWAMPGVLDIDVAISQAVLQTR